MDVDAIRSRAGAATPGPWDRATYSGRGASTCECSRWGRLLGAVPSNDAWGVNHIHERDRSPSEHEVSSASTFTVVAGNYDEENGGIVSDADAEFIAKAREDIPNLIAEVQFLRDALADMDRFASVVAPDEYRNNPLSQAVQDTLDR